MLYGENKIESNIEHVVIQKDNAIKGTSNPARNITASIYSNNKLT